MSPTEINAINREIAEWLGWRRLDGNTTPQRASRWVLNYPTSSSELPDFYSSDAAAITLLPVLVERGCSFVLRNAYCDRVFGIDVWRRDQRDNPCKIFDDPKCIHSLEPTISAAICNAVVELIRRERE